MSRFLTAVMVLCFSILTWGAGPASGGVAFLGAAPGPVHIIVPQPQSLAGSKVVLTGSDCWSPGSSQTFCFTTDTYTSDWEYVYTLWLAFPSDWTVTGVAIEGAPSCTGGGSWGAFSWAPGATPNVAVISQARYQSPTDHCTAGYCVTVTTGAGAGNAAVSWYWDGDGYGGAPHNPCSNDSYTPAGQPTCDQAVEPPATIPPMGGQWATVASSSPSWAGSGYPICGCTARNGSGQWVTYLLGDTAGSGPVGFWGYNHATNSWFNPGASGTPSDRWAPGWAYDPVANRCYVTGGATTPGGGNITAALLFDPVVNSFTALPSLTTARDFHASWVTTIDGTRYLCVAGGVDAASNVFSTTQCYDLTNLPGSWGAENALMGALPAAKWGGAFGTAGSRCYFASGADASFAITDSAYYFDDADNAWHSAGNSGALVYRTAGAVSDSDFYILGGSPGGFTPTASGWVYRGGTWSAIPAMPHARMDLVAGTGAQDELWVVDGYGAVATDYVDHFSPCGGTVCPTITVSPATLPDATIGTVYGQTLGASGGTAPYAFSVTSGTLPAGLSLDASGNLSGTPTVLGSVSFTVTATDAAACTGSQAFTLNVVCPTLTLSPTTLPDALAGAAYSQTLTAAPAGTTYSYAVTAGALPPGIALTAAGLLSGTPTHSGPYTFTVTATGWGSCTGSQAYTLTVTCPAISVSPSTLPGGILGTPYSATFTAAGGLGGYTFAVTAGALPTGLTLSPAGLLSGTLGSSGSFSFTVTATDTAACTGSASYGLTIGAYDMSFYDDGGHTQLCVNTHNGTYAFTIFSGSGAGTYTGLCTIAPGRLGMVTITSYGSRTTLGATYGELRHVAQATFTTPGRSETRSDGTPVIRLYKATLTDSDTLDDPPCDGGGPVR